MNIQDSLQPYQDTADPDKKKPEEVASSAPVGGGGGGSGLGSGRTGKYVPPSMRENASTTNKKGESMAMKNRGLAFNS